MKTINLTSLFLVCALAFTSCKKDRTEKINKAQNAKEFTKTFGAQAQEFSNLSATSPISISLDGGTKLNFDANSFTINGQPVSGNVTIKAYEMLNRSSVLFSGTNTNHISGAPLVSQGFIYFDAMVNGVSVDQQLAKPVQITMPAKGKDFTMIWAGVEQVGDVNQMAWQAPKNANGNNQQREVKAIEDDFIFDFGQTGWVNCDIFYSSSAPKTTVKISLTNNPGTLATFRGFTGETFVFYCAKNDNVVAQLYTQDGPNAVKSYENSMPIGSEGKFISFSIKSGKYYYAEKEVTITADMNESLTLAETSESAIQTAISNLDNY